MNKYLSLKSSVFFLVVIGNINIAFAAINVENALLNYQQKINQLKHENKKLNGQIELLQQRQKASEDKITSLFKLIKYKKNNETLEQYTLKTNQKDKQAKKKYTNARRALSSGQYPQAITIFKHYLQQYPKNTQAADAHYWLAKSYLAQKDYAVAEKIFIAFQKNNPQHHKLPNALLDLAKIYVQLNQNDKALKALNTIRRKFTTHQIWFAAASLLKKITPVAVQPQPNTPSKILPKNTFNKK